MIATEFDPSNEDVKWAFEGDQIVHIASGMAVDIAAADTGTGARVITWEKHDGDNQKWKLEYQ